MCVKDRQEGLRAGFGLVLPLEYISATYNSSFSSRNGKRGRVGRVRQSAREEKTMC